ncbi:MAG: PhnD/SsuA/transferrin family substrate-binding protein [Candidatus Lernaella stagnicola]|nr:PhnD/SsuA/transferrin family substrate-binding protein [Candidatus Lernaella stagnicola]
MKPNARRHVVFAAGMLFVMIAAIAVAGSHHLAVIRPGGPPATDQAHAQVAGLMHGLAATAGWPAGSADARYFNTTDDGYRYVKSQRPGFVFTTPGFYLAYRDELKLQPLTRAVLREGDTIQYFVVAKKGGASSLADLKGKTLAGAHLAEPAFVERIVLGGQLKLGDDVQAKVTSGFAALKNLHAGTVDAVLLDSKEKQALAALPFAGDLVVIFTSATIPNTGIMAVGGNVSAAEAAALRKAAADFCGSAAGKAVCDTFGIERFVPADASVYQRLVDQYGR